MGGRGAGGGGKGGGGGGGGGSEAANISMRKQLNSAENALSGVRNHLASSTKLSAFDRRALIRQGISLETRIKALRKTLGASVTPGL